MNLEEEITGVINALKRDAKIAPAKLEVWERSARRMLEFLVHVAVKEHKAQLRQLLGIDE